MQVIDRANLCSITFINKEFISMTQTLIISCLACFNIFVYKTVATQLGNITLAFK